MKILYFIGTLRSGGKERRLIELMKGLKSQTDYKILLVLAFNQIDYDYFYDLGIKYISIDKIPNSKSINVFFQLNTIVKQFKPDVIHTWGSMQSFYMGPVAFFHNVPLINSQITDAPPYMKKFSLRNFINRINFAFSSIVLSNSKAGLKSYGVDKLSKSKVIYNGFDFSRIDNLVQNNELRILLNIKETIIITMVASFSKNKDYKTFLEAVRIIHKNNRNIAFLCVGDGDLRAELEDAYSSEGLYFLGRRNDVESIMNISDIGVLISNKKVHGEGISNSLMEFMALGKPVIASDNGGNSELVINNESGIILQYNDAKLLSDAISYLAADFKKRKKMGKEANERIINYFSIDRMVNEFRVIYQELG